MKRNFGLDIIRAFSIWLVLLDHLNINIRGLQPMRIGSIGVEFFFVLSGFLIGGILFRDIDKGKKLPSTIVNFWTRRWLRILPLYYLALVFKYSFIDSSIGGNIFYYFLFLQNNFYGVDFMGVSWSLVIEEWFYLIAPLYLFISVRYLKTNKKITGALVLFIISINILRFLYVAITNAPFHGVNANFPFRLDSLFLGVSIAFFNHRQMKLYKYLSTPVSFFTGLIIFTGYIYYYWNLAYPNNLVNDTILPRTIGFFILPFSISLMVPYISLLRKIELNMTYKKAIYFFITYTSIFTYAIYLSHMFIFHEVSKFNFGANTVLKAIVCIILTYAISTFLYLFYEKPFLRLRDKFSKK